MYGAAKFFERASSMDYKSKWEKNPWKPRKIIYEPTDEKLTASVGQYPYNEVEL
jgi:hypothetical protein